MEWPIIAVVFVLIFGAAFVGRRRQNRRWQDAAKSAAAALQLEYIPGLSPGDKGYVCGTYEGYDVDVRWIRTAELPDALLGPHSSRRRGNTTCVRTSWPSPLVEDLVILRKAPTLFGIKLAASHGLQTGDKKFDSLYSVSANDQTAALEFLVPNVRSALIEYASSFILMEADAIYYGQSAIDSETLCRVIEGQHRIVRSAHEAHEAHEGLTVLGQPG
jgi:hypothetical protein